MFHLFSHRQELVDETSLSRFVRGASSAEKKRIYANVILKASEEQKRLMENVAAIKRDQEMKKRDSARSSA